MMMTMIASSLLPTTTPVHGAHRSTAVGRMTETRLLQGRH